MLQVIQLNKEECWFLVTLAAHGLILGSNLLSLKLVKQVYLTVEPYCVRTNVRLANRKLGRNKHSSLLCPQRQRTKISITSTPGLLRHPQPANHRQNGHSRKGQFSVRPLQRSQRAKHPPLSVYRNDAKVFSPKPLLAPASFFVQQPWPWLWLWPLPQQQQVLRDIIDILQPMPIYLLQKGKEHWGLDYKIITDM